MNDTADLSPRLLAWRDRGRSWVAPDGHRLFHIDEGPTLAVADPDAPDPPTLLLLHAYPTASWGFHKVWPRLAERFRCVTLDLLGSGFSDKPVDHRYDIASLADHVEALLDQLGVERAHLFAHAYGVTTGQELLARDTQRRDRADRGDSGDSADRPPRFASACFVNGGLFVEGTRPTRTQKLLLSPIGPLIARHAPQPYRVFCKKLARNFGPTHQPTEREMLELWQLLRHDGGHRLVPKTLGYLRERAAQRDRWVGPLQRTDIPLCLVNGAADPVSGVHVPRIWQELVPHGRLIQLDPGIGHYPPLEAPDDTVDALLRFHDEDVRVAE